MSSTPRHPRSRRPSGPGLDFTNLSISPLTSTSLTEAHIRNSSRRVRTREGSYIQGLSAPTTPSLLSHAHSHSKTPLLSSPATASYFPPSSSSTSLPKSKSASTLLRRSTDDLTASEWMHRTGALLTGETRSSKGQSWIVSRESSTSLVRLNGEREGDYEAEGPDLEAEWEDADEEEMEGGFGVGMWIDRVIGWTVFAEEEESDDEEEEETVTVETVRRRSVPREEDAEKRREREEGWNDPAWLLSLASKLVF